MPRKPNSRSANPASPEDGGIPFLFQFERQWPAASDPHCSAEAVAMRSHCVIVTGILTAVLVGCAAPRSAQVTLLPARSSEPTLSSAPIPALMPHSYALVEEKLTLSAAHPVTRRGECQIRLVSIVDDGATRIRIVETGKELTAHPGGFFASSEFGSQGLQIIAASKSTGAVSMISRGCTSE